MNKDKLAAFYNHSGQVAFRGLVPVGTLGAGIFQGFCGYSEKDALNARLLEIEKRIREIETRLDSDSDSDTRPEDGDAKQGSARE